MATTLRISSGGGAAGAQPPAEDPGENAPTLALDSAETPAGRPRCPTCGERFSRGSRFCAFDGARLADAPEEARSDPLIGQVIGGKYTLVRPIGEGGMGSVYEVRHTALDRKFALKLLRPEIAQNAEHMQRFLQEARAAAAIGHPNIVSVSDFGEHEVGGKKVPFFVMELLRGTSLADLLKNERSVPPKRCAKIIAGCADALGAAHASGVIHRDLKPDNIFLSGDSDEIKVLDFGVAKMQGAARLTKIGMVFGTPHYMSPEQARGQSVDHRADIYALGVILYECLSGHVPFEADTSMGVLTKQIFANPEPIERVAPDASHLGALGPIVMRCLAKEPDDRYASMSELAAALRQFLENPQAAAADALAASSPKHKALRLREGASVPPPPPSEAEPSPRSWSRLALFAAAAVSLLSLVGVTTRAMLLGGATGDVQTTAPVASATSSATAGPVVASAAVSGPAPSIPASAADNPMAAPLASVPAGTTSARAPIPMASSNASSTPPRATSTAPTGGIAKPAPPGTGGVVDPWGGSKKKTTGSNGVVDPWASKKR